MVVVWALNGMAIETNLVPASAPGALANVSLSGSFPPGANVLEVGVTDGTNVASCSTTITVVDATAPVISDVAASPNILWPPNHRMVSVNILALVTDSCGAARWRIVGVRSNEPVNGRGGGKSSADWRITGDHTVLLRAERSGDGNGRIYYVTVQARDASGNVSQPRTVTVTVPKSPGHGKSPQPPTLRLPQPPALILPQPPTPIVPRAPVPPLTPRFPIQPPLPTPAPQ